ncbi:hypothetical protein [Thiosulfativibrio zosterae]|uniref:Uncharacterized protein n=1 Tax=Thiosulfativibrio zosterae TaxID=2675053 RepID=A0A6F8PQZ0_9GAMM|nr:hypothetical protein [Thiosulfativibrio zosterae]BBP44543.1 hypothetical protein THMIRHAT_22890 [Thiosulfativibrio zosterae]
MFGDENITIMELFNYAGQQIGQTTTNPRGLPEAQGTGAGNSKTNGQPEENADRVSTESNATELDQLLLSTYTEQDLQDIEQKQKLHNNKKLTQPKKTKRKKKPTTSL